MQLNKRSTAAIHILFVILIRVNAILGFASPAAPQNTAASGAASADQLDWQVLGRDLLTLRAQGIPDEVLIATRLDIKTLSRVRIGKSQVPNAGRGVFATMDCKKGELLTCYPGDVLLHPSGMYGLPDELEADDEKLRSLLSRYCIGVTDDYAIMGLPDLGDDMAYVGHLINDGARPPVVESEMESYVWESNLLANVEHAPLEGLHAVTVASRDIKKGEELLIFYGPTFWMDHIATWQGETP